MINSTAERTQVECSTCGAVTAEIWLIIDDTERPDLVRLLREDMLHRVSCPTCGADLIEVDAPVVLYRPHRDPAVLFLPAKHTTAEEDDEHAGALLSELRDRLGDLWRAEWLQPLNWVSQEMARFTLSEEAASFHPMEVGTLCTAALELTRAESWDDVRTLIQDHPALLAPLADVILAKLAADQPDARARVSVDNDRVFLERCRAIGPDLALAERSGVDRSARWPEDVIEAVRLFVAPPTWRGSRDVLEANPTVLLDPIIDLVMADGAELFGDDPAMVEFVEGHRRVLDVARRSGIDAAFAGLSEPKAAPEPRTRPESSAGGASADLPDDNNPIELERAALHRMIEADPGGPVARATAIHRSSQIADFAERIELLGEARRLVDRDKLPLMWQVLTLETAEALVYASRGDLSANSETALALCAEAEQVADRERWPDLWGLLRSIQGEAYRHRAIGDRADNLERAIVCAEQALQIHTRDAEPVKWAGSQHNLGIAYLDRVHGGRAGNIEMAIACLQQALEIRTRDHHPTAWADTQVSLGNAYQDRIHGSATENIEQAITCFERALEVVTRQSEPQSWARTMNSLGTAYRSRLLGDAADNTARTINCFQRALQVRTRNDCPADWAMTEVNLGNAFLSAAGDDGGQQIERAIACYQHALQEYTRDRYPNYWAAVQVNLGNAYGQRADGDQRENRGRAAAALEAASGVYTRDAYPERWAAIHRNLASLHSAGGATVESRAVLAHLQNALSIYTVDAFPADHRLLSGYLGSLYFDAGRWDDAHAAYESAIAAGEAAYQAATTTVSRQAELAEAGHAVPHDAFCLARSGRFAAAVERLEGGRARALADALARDRVGLDSAAADDRHAFDAARQRIRTLEAAARAAAAGPNAGPTAGFAGYVAALQAARRDLANVIHRVRGYVTDFMDTEIGLGAIATASVEPLIYLISTRRGGMALIVPPGANELDERHCVFLDGFRAADLTELLAGDRARAGAGGYLIGQLSGDPATLSTALDRVLPVLATRVMGPIAARLGALGYRRATLIPGGGMALLPLHAAVADDVTLAYAPSARTLHSARVAAGRRAGRPLQLCGVADPLPNPRPLRFARLELTALATFVAVASRQLLSGEHATRTAVVQGLTGATHLHFACHGLYRFEQPLASGLLLGNEQWLTLTMLLDEVGLPNARLAVLSACQTAITDIRKVPDEAIGLPAGFMQAGVPAVIGSLWPVEDLSTALLMDRFYRLHLGGDGGRPLGAASALRQAQFWLRDATGHELAARCEEIHRATRRSDAALYRAIRYFRSASEERPFAHPFYWAAFTFSGAES